MPDHDADRDPDEDWPGDVSEDERRARVVLNHVHALAEYFDGVQVFVSLNRREVGGGRIVSSSLELGTGNWYARYGHVREWLLTQEARMRRKAAREADEELDG